MMPDRGARQRYRGYARFKTENLSVCVVAGLVRATHAYQHAIIGDYVYILASAPNGILYVGVTNDLVRRTYEHRQQNTWRS